MTLILVEKKEKKSGNHFFVLTNEQGQLNKHSFLCAFKVWLLRWSIFLKAYKKNEIFNNEFLFPVESIDMHWQSG